jgi:hypothetical protein
MATDNSRTVILLTDGRSNIGVDVNKAISYSNKNNVQVFTIGVGTIEGGSPAGLNVSLKLDDELLSNIAEYTNAKYNYAADKEAIKDAYNDIILISERKISLNMTITLILLALFFSFIDWMLMNTKYKRIP